MTLRVLSSFLPKKGVTVNISDELTLKEIFIEAERVAAERSEDGATRKFRDAWYEFFHNQVRGFSYWDVLEVKVDNKISQNELKYYIEEKNKSLKNEVNGPSEQIMNSGRNKGVSVMALTLNELKKVWNKDVLSELEIDIAGEVVLNVGHDHSKKGYNIAKYPTVEHHIPFELNISVETFISVALLYRKYKKRRRKNLKSLEAKSWGIWFGLEDDWKYFTCRDPIRSMAAFYEELMFRTLKSSNPDNFRHIDIVLRKRGKIFINDGQEDRSIEFNFSEVGHRVSDYANKLPKGYEQFLDSQQLSLLVSLTRNGEFTLFPVFHKPEEQKTAELKEAFESYKAKGDLLKQILSETTIGKRFEEALYGIAYNMASKGCFTAICAPSLSGKTQLAFSINKNVLYFPLLRNSNMKQKRTQAIYRCFAPHVRTLLQCVSRDLELGIRIYSRMNENEDDMFPFLTATQATEVFGSTHKSLTVGFFLTVLQSLAKGQSRFFLKRMWNFLNREETDDTSFLKRFWKMEGFEGKVIFPKTIKEFEEEIGKINIEMPFIFLDEFPSAYDMNSSSGSPYGRFSRFPHLAATLRNILRAMKKVCFVMGTDTRLANLAGASFMPRGGSRGEPLGSLWCAMITQFLRIPLAFFKTFKYKGRTVIELLNKVEVEISRLPLTPWCQDSSGEDKAKELCTFLMDQLESSRPGVAWAIVVAIAKVDNWTTFKSIIGFLQYLCAETYFYVFSRKDDISEYGTVCSLLGNRLIGYYRDENFEKSAVDFQRLIDRHFYYIKSPFIRGENLEYFFLYHVSEKGERDYHRNSLIKTHFPFVAMAEAQDFVDGPSRSGAFQVFLPSPEEEFFLCATFWNDWGNTQRTHVYSNHNSIGVSMRNHYHQIDNFLSNDGKSAEEIWSCAVINASHRNRFDPLVGTFFLRTLILSAENVLISKKCHLKKIAKEQEANVTFPVDSILESELQNCLVPYLCPAGSFSSQNLYSLFPSVLGKCVRAKNKDMVDFAFEMSVFNPSEQRLYSAIGLVEMKDWRKELKSSDVANILRRIPYSEFCFLAKGYFWGRCKLHFIFCNTVDFRKRALPGIVKTGPKSTMKCLASRGFSRIGFPLSEEEDRDSYCLYLAKQRELNDKEKKYNKKAKEHKFNLDQVKEQIDRLKEQISLSDEEKQKLNVLESEKKKCQQKIEELKSKSGFFSSNSDDIFVPLTENEEEIAKKHMPKDKGLVNLLKKQHINLYCVNESEVYVGTFRRTKYDLEVIYEDNANDVISIIIPLQKDFSHLGNAEKETIFETLDVSTLDEGNDEPFGSYVSQEIIKAISSLYGRLIDDDDSVSSLIPTPVVEISDPTSLSEESPVDSESENESEGEPPSKYPRRDKQLSVNLTINSDSGAGVSAPRRSQKLITRLFRK